MESHSNVNRYRNTEKNMRNLNIYFSNAAHFIGWCAINEGESVPLGVTIAFAPPG